MRGARGWGTGAGLVTGSRTLAARPSSYIIDSGVCFLVLTERAYPKRLAFNYLEELQKEFNLLYANEVDAATRPYAFIKFDAFIQKTKRLYMDIRAQRNVNKLNEDLSAVQNIMMTNIQELLGRKDKLDSARRARAHWRCEAPAHARPRCPAAALQAWRTNPGACATVRRGMRTRRASSTGRHCCASTAPWQPCCSSSWGHCTLDSADGGSARALSVALALAAVLPGPGLALGSWRRPQAVGAGWATPASSCRF